jgi:threonine dehydrogenase-like Zn-dependent dehydrogenase
MPSIFFQTQEMSSQDALELEVQRLEGPGSNPRRCVTAIVIGCGNRGQAYSSYALEFPRRLKIVGVVDPVEHRTSKLRRLHDISNDDMVSDDWRHFSSMEKKVADVAIITTPDKLHKDPAVAFAKLGNFSFAKGSFTRPISH